jgi:hypothetical protein
LQLQFGPQAQVALPHWQGAGGAVFVSRHPQVQVAPGQLVQVQAFEVVGM